MNNQFAGATLDEKWEAYLRSLESVADISVLGVTDYFSIAGYTHLKEQKDAGRLANISLAVFLHFLPTPSSLYPAHLPCQGGSVL